MRSPMDISDSGFISPETISAEWTEITLLQQRNKNKIYQAQRYGKRFLLKGLQPDCQSQTDFRLLQEKEFALGISLGHSNIAETYSLEEVPECGRCIVIEYVDGCTLAQWLSTRPSRAARERVLTQLMDALEYIHSVQLVHSDLKSSNILITRNGQNVKLIDFGLSDTDSTNKDNDLRHDIATFGNVLSSIFPHRYYVIRRKCINQQYASISDVRRAIERNRKWKTWIPYLVAIGVLSVSALLLVQTYHLYQESEQLSLAASSYMTAQHRENEMIEKVEFFVSQEISQLEESAKSCRTYLEFCQTNYPTFWTKSALIRDSIANIYSDDESLRLQCIEVWTTLLGERVLKVDAQVKQSKPLR